MRQVRLLGLESRTNGLKVPCSNRLSYSPTTSLQGAAARTIARQNRRKPRWRGRNLAKIGRPMALR